MNQIAQARKSCGMTQFELAKAAGVGRSTIARMEADEAVDVRASTLLKLASVLHCSLDDLFSLRSSN